MYYQLLENLRELDEAFGVVEAGWIHPNGKFEIIPNYVMGDHDKSAFRKLRPEERLPYDREVLGDEYTEYLNQGHIRYIQSSRGFNIELRVMPTESQMRAIRKGIKEGTGEFFFSTIKLSSGGTSWAQFREELAKL